MVDSKCRGLGGRLARANFGEVDRKMEKILIPARSSRTCHFLAFCVTASVPNRESTNKIDRLRLPCPSEAGEWREQCEISELRPNESTITWFGKYLNIKSNDSNRHSLLTSIITKCIRLNQRSHWRFESDIEVFTTSLETLYYHCTSLAPLAPVR